MHKPRTAGVGIAASTQLKLKTLQPAINCIVSKTKNVWSHPHTYTSHATTSDVLKITNRHPPTALATQGITMAVSHSVNRPCDRHQTAAMTGLLPVNVASNRCTGG